MALPVKPPAAHQRFRAVNFLLYPFSEETVTPLVVSLSTHERTCRAIHDPSCPLTGAGRTDGVVPQAIVLSYMPESCFSVLLCSHVYCIVRRN